MNNDLISRKAVLDYLENEKRELIEGISNNDVIPIDARKGAILSVKTIINFITKLKS